MLTLLLAATIELTAALEPAPPIEPAACSDPSLAALEAPRSVPDSAPPPAYGGLGHYGRRVHLGVGHVRPDSAHWFGWLERVVLPVFEAPGSEPREWLVNGWRLDAVARTWEPFAASGLVETGYEVRSFVVLERRTDGWMRVLLDEPAEDRADGWIHECLTDLGELSLSFEPWSGVFASGSISPLYFRSSEPHVLRAGPSRTAQRLHLIPADRDDYHIEWLDVRNDWARVRVTEPSDYCLLPGEVETRTYEGWVKWWDEEIGPWFWYYTRGC